MTLERRPGLLDLTPAAARGELRLAGAPLRRRPGGRLRDRLAGWLDVLGLLLDPTFHPTGRSRDEA